MKARAHRQGFRWYEPGDTALDKKFVDVIEGFTIQIFWAAAEYSSARMHSMGDDESLSHNDFKIPNLMFDPYILAVKLSTDYFSHFPLQVVPICLTQYLFIVSAVDVDATCLLHLGKSTLRHPYTAGHCAPGTRNLI